MGSTRIFYNPVSMKPISETFLNITKKHATQSVLRGFDP